MTKFSYVMRKFFGNLWGRPLAALGSVLSLFLLFLLFDLAWVGSLSAIRFYDARISEIDIEVFLSDDVADSTVTVLAEAIQNIDGVEEIQLVTRDNARERLNDIMGVDLLEGMENNPLPRSLIISFQPNFLNMVNLSRLRSDLSRLQGVDEIMFPSQWLEKAESTKQLVEDLLFLLGVLILIAVVLNSIHSIILTARTRMEELLQMQLLGAGPVFLMIPFILEGIFYGLAASVAGWVVMHYGMELLSFRDLTIVIPTLPEIIYFCFVASAIGMISGYIGIRRSI